MGREGSGMRGFCHWVMDRSEDSCFLKLSGFVQYQPHQSGGPPTETESVTDSGSTDPEMPPLVWSEGEEGSSSESESMSDGGEDRENRALFRSVSAVTTYLGVPIPRNTPDHATGMGALARVSALAPMSQATRVKRMMKCSSYNS